MKEIGMFAIFSCILIAMFAFSENAKETNTQWLQVRMPLKHMATETVQIGLRADGTVVWKK